MTYCSTNDSQGLRVTPYTNSAPPEFRVLLLGDSFTYGRGVNDEETFAYRLEKYSLAAHRPIQAVNAGNPGKGTDYELKWFQTRGSQLHPDLAVLCFFSNDFADNQRGEYYRLADDGNLVAKPLFPVFSPWEIPLRRSAVYNWLLTWSQAANLLRGTLYDALRKQQAVAKGQTFPASVDARGNYVNEENKKLTDVYLGHLKRAVAESGSTLLVFYLPRFDEVRDFRQSRALSKDEQTLHLLSKSRDIALVSLTPAFADSDMPIKELYNLEAHWTAAGHALAAKVMFPEIDKRLPPRQ